MSQHTLWLGFLGRRDSGVKNDLTEQAMGTFPFMNASDQRAFLLKTELPLGRNFDHGSLENVSRGVGRTSVLPSLTPFLNKYVATACLYIPRKWDSFAFCCQAEIAAHISCASP